MKNYASFLILLLVLLVSISAAPLPVKLKVISNQNFAEQSNLYMYDTLQLNSFGLSKEAFIYAMEGYRNLATTGQITNDDVLSIVDFSLPSSRKRLFVIDMEKGKLLFNTYVAHGKNSGKDSATFFSNEPNSFRSSLGFYITGDTYKGQHGYSLRLEGVEEGINDNALSRGIVMHAASYVNERLAMQRGYIGRSEGCPALPVNMYRPIIQKIRNGSCLFVFGHDDSYLTRTRLITEPFIQMPIAS